MPRAEVNTAKQARSATRAALMRYLAALAILGGITSASFLLVRSLIQDMRYSETLISEAADLRSSLHKTMLAIDAVEAGGGEHAVTAAHAEADVLRASTDRLLLLLAEAEAADSIWNVVRRSETGLEPNVRRLIESAKGWALRGAPHGHSSGHEVPMEAVHSASGNSDVSPTTPPITSGHNPAAMEAVDELIAKLRAESRREQDHAAFTHDALGYGTLVLLLIEALIVFRPLMRTAEIESQRADEATHELEYLATHDTLTGLLNRAQIDRVLQVAVKEAASVNQQLGLILLDMDEFKPINDTLGHAAGDTVLTTVAQRIRQAVRPGDLCGRLGGDEFIVILPHVVNEADIQATANAILACLAEPIPFEGIDLTAKASIGYAIFPIAGSNVSALMSAADLAMYDAKRQGRGRVSEFSQQMRSEAERSRSTEAALQSAFASRQFEVYYQLIHSEQHGVPTAVEALVRWRHPDRGLVDPLEFLSDIRRTGRMESLTEFVISEAIAQYAVWRAAACPLRAIHINVGEEFLNDREAQRSVADLLEAHGLHAGELVLEITEYVRFADSGVQSALAYLASKGITIAVDDFGVGAISIGDLNHPAIGVVKLDKAVVSAATKDGKGASVLLSLATLLRALGKEIVAEGIETAHERTMVKQAGIQLLQGYYFDRPNTAAKITEALASGKKIRASKGDDVAA